MAGQPRAFEIVDDDLLAGTSAAPQAPQRRADAGLLLLGLKTVSQRAIAAIADLFTLVTVGSAFWLWMSIHDPDPNQLIALAMYGCFVLAANWIVRRSR